MREAEKAVDAQGAPAGMRKRELGRDRRAGKRGDDRETSRKETVEAVGRRPSPAAFGDQEMGLQSEGP